MLFVYFSFSYRTFILHQINYKLKKKVIAEPSSRGKGIGLEAVRIIMNYSIKYLNVELFTVKIGMVRRLVLVLNYNFYLKKNIIMIIIYYY